MKKIALCLATFALTIGLAACANQPKEQSQQGQDSKVEEKTDYSKYTYEQFEQEDLSKKTVKYQFLDNDEDNYLVCMNLHDDGSLAMYECVKLEADTGWYDAEHHIRWMFFGNWSETKAGEVTTLSIKTMVKVHIEAEFGAKKGDVVENTYSVSDDLLKNNFEISELKIMRWGFAVEQSVAVYNEGTVKYNNFDTWFASWHQDNFPSA